MGLRSWWQVRQQQKITRYIRAHTSVALQVLRQDPTLATYAVTQALDLQAGSVDANAPKRDTIPYPALGQLGMGGRAPLNTALPKPSPINMRRFSEYPPARRAINALCNPILGLQWAILPTDPTLDETKPDTWPADMRQRVETLTYCLKRPNPMDSWRSMIEAVLEDICIGGFGAIEVQITDDPTHPYWFYPVDGQSVHVNTYWDGSDREIPRYTQSLGYAGMSVLTSEAVRLLDEELLYIRLNPRTNTPFGLGYLEVAFNAINAYIGAFDFATRRASNATPDYLLFLGENTDIPTTRAWRDYWKQLIEGYGQVPIIGGGVNPQVLQLRGSGQTRDPLYIQWQQWIVRQIAMAFGLSSLKMGLEQDVNRSTSQVMDLEDWQSSAPIAEAFSDGFTTHTIWRVLGWDDLKFAWTLRITDDVRQADVLKKRWEANSITIDEQRAVWGDPPLDGDRGAWTMLEAVGHAEAASQSDGDRAAPDTPTGTSLDPQDFLPDVLSDPIQDDVPHNGV